MTMTDAGVRVGPSGAWHILTPGGVLTTPCGRLRQVDPDRLELTSRAQTAAVCSRCLRWEREACRMLEGDALEARFWRNFHADALTVGASPRLATLLTEHFRGDR